MTFEEMFITVAIGRVSALYHAVKNQSGSSAGQENLMTVLSIPATLDDDIGMFLKKGNYFL